MYLQNSVRLLQVVVLSCASVVLAGPGGHLELVNLSPYDWKLTYQHSYQMDWQPTDLIPAGAQHEQYVEWWYHHGNNGDCGAEATYRLEGTEYEFTIQARQQNRKSLLIEYNDALAAKTMTQDKVIDLGFDHDGSVLFVLSGDGVEPYVSSQAPKNWMQATLPTIGHKELREISMPMSHNAGMYKVSHKYFGMVHNSLCQTQDIYSQLSFGARWLDIRPAFTHGKWNTVHASKLATGQYAGATGADFVDMVNDINRFTAEAPGELIVLEISHELDATDSGGVQLLKDGLPPNRWQELYKLLEGINDLWLPTDPNIPDDLTAYKMSGFIQPGSKSAVIIRLPGAAPLPDSGNPAFVKEGRLLWTGEWTSTSDVAALDQAVTANMNDVRTNSKSQLYRLPYNVTPKITDMLDIANFLHSIIGESMWAEHKLFQTIWAKLTPNTYPNLIEMDNIHNSQITAISMVINQRYANSDKRNKRDEGASKPQSRNQLMKISVENLAAERYETAKTFDDFAIILSAMGIPHPEFEWTDLSDDSTSSSPEPEWTTLTSTSTSSFPGMQITSIPTPTTKGLVRRARGPRRHNDHLWNTDSKTEWLTGENHWLTANNFFCTGSRYWEDQYSYLTTVVFEYYGPSTSSATTVTVSAMSNPAPTSYTTISATSTIYKLQMPTPIKPTPPPDMHTITIWKEEWDASTEPLHNQC